MPFAAQAQQSRLHHKLVNKLALLQHKQPTHVVCQVVRCTVWLIEQEYVLQHSEHSSHSSSCCGYAMDGSAGFADG